MQNLDPHSDVYTVFCQDPSGKKSKTVQQNTRSLCELKEFPRTIVYLYPIGYIVDNQAL